MFKCLWRYWCKQSHTAAGAYLFISAYKNWWGVNAGLTVLSFFCTLNLCFSVSSCLLETRSYRIACSRTLTTASLKCVYHFSWVCLVEGNCIISDFKLTELIVNLWNCWIMFPSGWKPMGKLYAHIVVLQTSMQNLFSPLCFCLSLSVFHLGSLYNPFVKFGT